ncbi:nudC domain-containing protein 3 [Diaphorina citri]|uniref:NudC domain-containing protein 3 n=1 Tax=Diaphorina citri TaxID=121845 RepID=A0A1S3DP67_DIACI|nr:nudC domain-containing protein 3 [Diaphorina citri]
MEESEDSMYDEFLMNILCKEQSIPKFLSVIFGFLYRRTDLFVEQPTPGHKFGYPPGQCEKLIYDSMKYFQNKAIERNKQGQDMQLFDQVVENEEVVMDNEEIIDSKQETKAASQGIRDVVISKESEIPDAMSSHTTVRVSENVLKSNQISVSVTATTINVLVDGNKLLSGDFAHSVRKDETVWTLTPGKYVQIQLEKAKEAWWDQLIKSEPKINLQAIDSTRPFSELPQEEQMKVNELIWNDYQKAKGLPTSEQMKTADLLKKAWNADGSPFKGRPFDPSILNTQ